MHDFVSTAGVQIGLASGAFSQGSDDCGGELSAQHEERPRPYAPTVTRRAPSLEIAYAVRAGRLTIVMINGLGREGSDSKRVCDDLHLPPNLAILAHRGPTGFGGLRFGLHGIY
jgi:hypothetical protein